ncbi:hypothetical protein EDEG_03706 [Edhazardia aedis USNM 41457]|uniref:Uncharacterized protein n=1 Tax=Edhazardia aedis (strain USNM 41457) TaxID=1003232 RepID=J9D1T5_EDHAE|nr:hypothetical protein EDEG_03706 [Edhazardia aedis USNM 41457]|eukprot:EJW01816.1 hypothetical protein EDEG_03706 [Edhazardia aedis USNM 41457]
MKRMENQFAFVVFTFPEVIICKKTKLLYYKVCDCFKYLNDNKCAPIPYLDLFKYNCAFDLPEKYHIHLELYIDKILSKDWCKGNILKKSEFNGECSYQERNPIQIYMRNILFLSYYSDIFTAIIEKIRIVLAKTAREDEELKIELENKSRNYILTIYLYKDDNLLHKFVFSSTRDFLGIISHATPILSILAIKNIK